MHEQDGELVHADVRSEPTDVWMKPIIATGIGIAVLGVAAHLICLWFFDWYKAESARDDPGLSALAAQERPKQKTPEPRLQTQEQQDLNRFRDEENARLNSYGWSDAKADRIHIPIKDALKLMANPEFARSRGIAVETKKGGGK
jgi:hypothetical protein